MPSRPFPDPPEPSSATWQSGTNLVEMVFDQVLSDGVLDTANWLVATGGPASVTGASVVGGVVQITLSAVPASVTAVTFSPPPFDVVAAGSGLAAEAFTGFPVVTT